VIFRLAAAGLLIATALTTPAPAEDDEAVRPKIDFMNRWREDWSVLADPRLRTEPLARSAPDPLARGGEALDWSAIGQLAARDAGL